MVSTKFYSSKYNRVGNLTSKSSPICGKHLYTLKDVSGHDEDFGSEAQIYGFNPMLNEKDGPPAQVKWQVDTKTKKNVLLRTDRDVAAYKRVICQDSDGDKISVTAVGQYNY